MFLSRINLDLRCKEARRDLTNPYQLHSTLCRAFSSPDTKCPEGAFLWRLEQQRANSTDSPSILIQSRKHPDWRGIGIKNWLESADPAIDLIERLRLDSLKAGQRFRFRLRANPSITRNGKRQGLLKKEDQEQWLERKGIQHGFSLPRLISFDFSAQSETRVDVRISQEEIIRDKQHSANSITIFSVLYDGMLVVDETEKFKKTLQDGIGHGKVVGLGLLSIAPIV